MKTNIKIPADIAFFEPSIEFLSRYMERLNVDFAQKMELKETFSHLLRDIIGQNITESVKEEISIDLSNCSNRLVVEILNKSRPCFLDSEPSANINYKNLGRYGQNYSLEIPIIKTKHELIQPPTEVEDIKIRKMQPNEAAQLTRLFYSVYGYNYISDFVYFPQQIRDMLASGKLESFVAVKPDGEFVGHVGILYSNPSSTVAEIAFGVVDPKIKSKGLFGKLFQNVIEEVRKSERLYSFFDFVTNHSFSQSLIDRYGFQETALFVGSQISDTQAKLDRLGLGADPKNMDRYSILLAIDKGVAQPFGSEITLPVQFGEIAEFILKPLGISWVPAPRFYPLAREGDYLTQYFELQKSVIFDFYQPGKLALENILKEWHHLLRNGYQYIGIDIPLNHPGIGQAHDYLAKHGFFAAGFVPYRNSSQLGFRFQAIGPTKVAFDQIKVRTPTARRILEVVRIDYERNVLL